MKQAEMSAKRVILTGNIMENDRNIKAITSCCAAKANQYHWTHKTYPSNCCLSDFLKNVILFCIMLMLLSVYTYI